MSPLRSPVVALFCALAAFSPAALAADLTTSVADDAAMAAITPGAIEAHIRFLADDLMNGRGPGTPGYDIAANYMESQFRQLGLVAAGDNGAYRQRVPLQETRLVNGSARLMLRRKGKKKLALVEGQDFLMSGNPVREKMRASAPVIFAGYGVSAPNLEYDDYAGLDVNGRIVAVLSNAPPRFANDQRAFYASGQTKRETAARHGAVGLLVIFTPEDQKRISWQRLVDGRSRGAMRWLDHQGRPYGATPKLNVQGVLSQAGAEKLFADSGHRLEEVFTAAQQSRPQSFPLGVKANMSGRASHRTLISYNVAGLLPGSDPKLASEYVVYTAHLDHLGRGVEKDGDAIYNGAYDNGSGSAILIEIARAFVTAPTGPRRSILFLAVTAEEKGLRGSSYFVHNPTVPLAGIVADINLDMPLMLHRLRDVIAFGAEHSSLGRTAAAAAREFGLTLAPDPFPQEVVFIRSDHYSFVQAGIPAVSLFPGFATGDPKIDGAKLFYDWMGSRYHGRKDDLSQPFDFDAGATFARLNYRIGRRVADATAAPRWTRPDFFADRFAPRVVAH